MKKFTKIVAILFCLLISFSVSAEDGKLKPFAGFDLPTLENILSGEKVRQAIESEGLSTVIGRMIHVQAEKTGQLNGLELDQLNYGKAVAVYNAFPNDLTPEKVLEIRDSRGLYFLPADYKAGDVHPSVRVTVSKTEISTKPAVIKPSAKPERDPAELFAERLHADREQIKILTQQLANLRVKNVNNTVKAEEVAELQQQLSELSDQLKVIDDERSKLVEAGDLTTQALKNLQQSYGEFSTELMHVRGEVKKSQGFTSLAILGFAVAFIVLLIFFILIAINLKKFRHWVKNEISAVKEHLAGHDKTLKVVNDRLNEHGKQIDQISAEMLDLLPEDFAKISKEAIASLPVTNPATKIYVEVPIRYGNDSASARLVIEKIDKTRIRVNIPKSDNGGIHQTIEITSDLVRMLRKAVSNGRFHPRLSETKAA